MGTGFHMSNFPEKLFSEDGITLTPVFQNGRLVTARLKDENGRSIKLVRTSYGLRVDRVPMRDEITLPPQKFQKCIEALAAGLALREAVYG